MKTFNYLPVFDIEDIFNTLNFAFNPVSQPMDNFRYKFSKDDENYFIELVVPSYEKDDINIDFENSELIISSSVNDEWKKEFKKVFKIKQDIDSDNISAVLENGILKIILPRTETSKSRKIKIK
jgi:HSP20 family protein